MDIIPHVKITKLHVHVHVHCYCKHSVLCIGLGHVIVYMYMYMKKLPHNNTALRRSVNKIETVLSAVA